MSTHDPPMPARPPSYPLHLSTVAADTFFRALFWSIVVLSPPTGLPHRTSLPLLTPAVRVWTFATTGSLSGCRTVASTSLADRLSSSSVWSALLSRLLSSSNARPTGKSQDLVCRSRERVHYGCIDLDRNDSRDERCCCTDAPVLRRATIVICNTQEKKPQYGVFRVCVCTRCVRVWHCSLCVEMQLSCTCNLFASGPYLQPVTKAPAIACLIRPELFPHVD